MDRKHFDEYRAGKKISTTEEYNEVVGGVEYLSALIDSEMYPKDSENQQGLWDMHTLLANKMLEWETETGITEQRINENL